MQGCLALMKLMETDRHAIDGGVANGGLMARGPLVAAQKPAAICLAWMLSTKITFMPT